jgi:hypothetical protein
VAGAADRAGPAARTRTITHAKARRKKAGARKGLSIGL